MFLTRMKNADLGNTTYCGVSTDDAEPCYHDHCVPTDINGCGLPDPQGRPRVWMPDAMAGFKGNCQECGESL